jgi:DNA transformation protein and related proteins
MADAGELADFVTDQLRRWAPVTARRLFSGSGLYRGSTLFALLIRDILYFRSDDVNRPDYEAAGMAAFSYRRSDGRVVVLPYSQVPAEVIEDADELARWADKAFAAALRKPVKRARRPGKRGAVRAASRRKPVT